MTASDHKELTVRSRISFELKHPPTLKNTKHYCLFLQETYKLPHRLIEKKRRDRINECIAQLKDLLPEHLKLTVSSCCSTEEEEEGGGGGNGIQCVEWHAPSSGCAVLLHPVRSECVSSQ